MMNHESVESKFSTVTSPHNSSFNSSLEKLSVEKMGEFDLCIESKPKAQIDFIKRQAKFRPNFGFNNKEGRIQN